MPTTLSPEPRSRTTAPARRAEPTGSNEEATPDAPSEDEVFDVLRAARRRAALRYLDANDGEATIETLAEHVAAVENGVAREAVTQRQRKRAYIALYQCHLPKMAEYGVIEYERERGLAQLRKPARAVLAHLSGRPAERPASPADPADAVAAVRRRVSRWLGR